ncbi:hypothetical protein K1719_032693 [Acacia pycnantha]|nr:hypothetical protein K1719_032693 [Acacia pycnantha]
MAYAAAFLKHAADDGGERGWWEAIREKSRERSGSALGYFIDVLLKGSFETKVKKKKKKNENLEVRVREWRACLELMKAMDGWKEGRKEVVSFTCRGLSRLPCFRVLVGTVRCLLS